MFQMSSFPLMLDMNQNVVSADMFKLEIDRFIEMRTVIVRKIEYFKSLKAFHAFYPFKV